MCYGNQLRNVRIAFSKVRLNSTRDSFGYSLILDVASFLLSEKTLGEV